YPTPRLAVGRWLRQRGLATAAIDLSDGLSTDLGHICEEGRVGAVVRAEDIPRAKGVRLELALHGGEDYELLFTAPASRRMPRRIAGVRVTRIGEIVKGRNMWLRDARGKRQRLEPRGWEHFAARANPSKSRR
ncbi:MAG TPA: thiamine-phosphate kinase, partial [Terriglobales bacterium]|nr:thiamine-phosphate kinase [Terriglobales bacterium]